MPEGINPTHDEFKNPFGGDFEGISEIQDEIRAEPEDSTSEVKIEEEKLDGYNENYFSKIAEILDKFETKINKESIEQIASRLQKLLEISSKPVNSLNEDDVEQVNTGLDEIELNTELFLECKNEFIELINSMSQTMPSGELEQNIKQSMHDRLSNDVLSFTSIDYGSHIHTARYLLEKRVDIKLENYQAKQMYEDDLYNFKDSLKKLVQNFLSEYGAFLKFILGLKQLKAERKHIVEKNKGNVAYGKNIYRVSSTKLSPEYAEILKIKKS